MKVAEVLYTYNNSICTMICIQDANDFNDYMELMNSSFAKTATKLLRSNTPVDRWDHLLWDKGEGDAITRAGLISAQLSGKSLWSSVGALQMQKLHSIQKSIAGGETVLVNQNGGYCCANKMVQIQKIYEIEGFEDYESVIRHNTKYLNLENDAVLEDYVKEKLGEIDPKFSYITSLRSAGYARLVGEMKKFKDYGGKALYLYTTAMDTDQVKFYCEAAAEAGIDKIHIEYSATPDDPALVDSIIEEAGLTKINAYE